MRTSALIRIYFTGSRYSTGHLRLVPQQFFQNRSKSHTADGLPSSIHKLTKRSSIQYFNARGTESPANVKKSDGLVILFAWIKARENHIDKYRAIYFKHGFDVMTVYSKPFDLMLPKIGAHVTAQDLLNYLLGKENNYKNIVVHGFSVGGYQFGEFIIKLKAAVEQSDHKLGAEKIVKQIKGVIFDSAADVHSAPGGIARSIAADTFKADIFEKLLKLYLKIMYPVCSRYLYAVHDAFYGNFMRTPALLLFSHVDKIGDAKTNFELAKTWTQLGIQVDLKAFDKSRHVSHLHQYPEEYEKQIEAFLHKIRVS
ncbi:transmembrane protein 53-like lethal (2) k09913 [Brevipalpus obovatus]|uniref:transmembrane protein 53-like lethal (2) k09913 n=1 Tax=Brevipalpus obovatus TaxID=246614 RepID=UPI003D9EFFA7